jgi:hypothetical protein
MNPIQRLKTSPHFQFVLAWGYLNLLLNLNYPQSEPAVWALLLPSLELWAVIVILCLLVQLGLRFQPALYLPLMALLIFFRMFRLADVMVPMYLNRAFNLYMDSRYLPDLLHLLYHSFPLPVLCIYGFAAATVAIVLAWGIWRAIEVLHAYFRVRRYRYQFLLGTVGLGIVLSGLGATGLGQGSLPGITTFYPRLAEEFNFIWQIHSMRAQGAGVVQLKVEPLPSVTKPLDKLNGASVYLFVVESYGHTVYGDPRHFRYFQSMVAEFEEMLKAQGFEVYSNYLRSPTYGGESWLAFGTLESGVRVDNQMSYTYLLNSTVKPLAQYFNQAGYRTVSVMPGTRYPWPEGAFLGYQQTYYAWDFNYQGPAFGWSTMPDQFVLDVISRREVKDARQPLFIRYLLTSSHAAFNQQPCYLADWSQLGDGAIYHTLDSISFPSVRPDLSNASEAYMTAIIYDFRVLKAYIEQIADVPALILILGDHQPNAQVTGSAPSWSVPIHVISRQRSLLEPFAQGGYTQGWIPQNQHLHRGMETFLRDFVVAFSR